MSSPLRVNREIHLKPVPGREPDTVETLTIAFVEEHSPFYSAGFRKDDRILKVNDAPVATLARAINLVHEIEASSKVTVQIERAGKILEYQFEFE